MFKRLLGDRPQTAVAKNNISEEELLKQLDMDKLPRLSIRCHLWG